MGRFLISILHINAGVPMHDKNTTEASSVKKYFQSVTSDVAMNTDQYRQTVRFMVVAVRSNIYERCLWHFVVAVRTHKMPKLPIATEPGK